MCNEHQESKPSPCIKVEPTRTKKAIETIKKILSPRDCCLFTLGINTAYRAGELLSITYSQVIGMTAGLKTIGKKFALKSSSNFGCPKTEHSV